MGFNILIEHITEVLYLLSCNVFETYPNVNSKTRIFYKTANIIFSSQKNHEKFFKVFHNNHYTWNRTDLLYLSEK